MKLGIALLAAIVATLVYAPPAFKLAAVFALGPVVLIATAAWEAAEKRERRHDR